MIPSGTRLLAGAAALVIAAGADAAVSTYTDRDEFEVAIAAYTEGGLLTFDSIDANSVIPSGTEIGEFTITHAIAGVDLMVVGSLPTTSGSNSLGTAGDLTLLASDAFTLAFPPALAIGLYVIGEDLLAGDVEIQTPLGNAPIGEPVSVVSDGATVHFAGLVESEPANAFSTATVVSFAVEAVGDFVWNVDDVVRATLPAPEPGGAAVAAVLALALLSLRREGTPRPARSAFRPDR